MKNFFTFLFSTKSPKSLIIKIALGVSAVAFIFSLVTLIRNIVIGSMVFVSVLQVIGTIVIVGICFAMVKIFSGIEEDEDDDDESEEDAPQEKEPEREEEEAVSNETESDDFDDTLKETPSDEKKSSDYDLDLFEE